MSDWRDRSEIQGDVVFFPKVTSEVEKMADEVFIWDLDKTYLDTSIDSLAGLWQAIIEKAFSKKNIPATNVLLKVLNQKYQERRQYQVAQQTSPIYFITASPPQMEDRIHEKLEYDSIFPFGMFFKDNLKNIRPGRFWRLTKQVGYKIQALLQLRARLAQDAKMVCFGDDSESDVVIYNLFSDICARRHSQVEIQNILKSFFVTGEQVETIFELQEKVPTQDPVQRIYINLATDTDPEYYFKFGRRTLATSNTFQLALDLCQNNRLSKEGIYSIAEEMIQNYDFTTDELIVSLDELIKRQVLGKNAYTEISAFLMGRGLLSPDFQPRTEPRLELEKINDWTQQLEGMKQDWVDTNVDYLKDY